MEIIDVAEPTPAHSPSGPAFSMAADITEATANPP
ncbi:hypothetical protein MHAS44199_05630 [Mycolicibacterium hassiacum DSM 44199]|nr:hypothetical protein [Mycolicibacterium hassiacum DSM 44199]